uniref:SSD domain-containing protein n=1 Tax=Steinernema glaseri TaxID=37863 RepID=A0A1I8AH50_9BILA
NSGTFHDSVKENFSDFIAKYVDFITSKLVSTIVCLFWIAFVVFSAIGISNLSISLTVEKLFSSDSCLIEMDHLRVANVIPHYTVATVFINNPGDLTDPKRLARLNSLVAEMESLPESWGSNSTNYFVKDLLAYEKQKNEWEREELGVVGSNQTALTEGKTGFDADDLPTFLKWPEYEMWRGFVKLHKDEQNHTHLHKFWFTTAYHGDRLVKWFERGAILHKWRQIVDKYKAEFNTSVYHDDAIYLDLIDNMPTDTWQSAVATLSCMAFICFVFMYNKFTVFVSSAAIASIMTGMLGLLTWQGVSMDPIMMAAMIISIGFSVDIPAHVAYHYHSAGLHADHALTVQQRLRHCLSSRRSPCGPCAYGAAETAPLPIVGWLPSNPSCAKHKPLRPESSLRAYLHVTHLRPYHVPLRRAMHHPRTHHNPGGIRRHRQDSALLPSLAKTQKAVAEEGAEQQLDHQRQRMRRPQRLLTPPKCFNSADFHATCPSFQICSFCLYHMQFGSLVWTPFYCEDSLYVKLDFYKVTR